MTLPPLKIGNVLVAAILSHILSRIHLMRYLFCHDIVTDTGTGRQDTGETRSLRRIILVGRDLH